MVRYLSRYHRRPGIGHHRPWQKGWQGVGREPLYPVFLFEDDSYPLAVASPEALQGAFDAGWEDEIVDVFDLVGMRLKLVTHENYRTLEIVEPDRRGFLALVRRSLDAHPEKRKLFAITRRVPLAFDPASAQPVQLWAEFIRRFA